MTNNITAAAIERRVVIVDDSRTIQAILDNAFSERTDFRVVGFSSDATMAVEMIRRLMPDVVTIDLNMPYIDGATLLRMIIDLKTVCKIVVSDAPLKNLALSASLIEAGAALCLGKSELAADPDKFFAKINAAAAETSKGERHYLGTIRAFDQRSTAAAQPSQANREKSFPVPVDEQQRLQIVRQKRLTNSEHERQFDLVTKHVARATGFPVSLLTFMDRDTQWIKSASGLYLESTPRKKRSATIRLPKGGPSSWRTLRTISGSPIFLL